MSWGGQADPSCWYGEEGVDFPVAMRMRLYVPWRDFLWFWRTLPFGYYAVVSRVMSSGSMMATLLWCFCSASICLFEHLRAVMEGIGLFVVDGSEYIMIIIRWHPNDLTPATNQFISIQRHMESLESGYRASITQWSWILGLTFCTANSNDHIDLSALCAVCALWALCRSLARCAKHEKQTSGLIASKGFVFGAFEELLKGSIEFLYCDVVIITEARGSNSLRLRQTFGKSWNRKVEDTEDTQETLERWKGFERSRIVRYSKQPLLAWSWPHAQRAKATTALTHSVHFSASLWAVAFWERLNFRKRQPLKLESVFVTMTHFLQPMIQLPSFPVFFSQLASRKSPPGSYKMAAKGPALGLWGSSTSTFDQIKKLKACYSNAVSGLLVFFKGKGIFQRRLYTQRLYWSWFCHINHCLLKLSKVKSLLHDFNVWYFCIYIYTYVCIFLWTCLNRSRRHFWIIFFVLVHGKQKKGSVPLPGA